MREVSCVKRIGAVRVHAFALVALSASLAACTNNSRPVSRADFSTAAVGRWQGTVGDSRETMSIKSDGTFICRLNQTGFIANMLYPVVPGTVSGTWIITGNVMTLMITGEKNERSLNKTASSVIVSFKENELVLKSDRGETSSFVRIRAP
jgi:hypothetical protein